MPGYREIAAALRAAIERGEYPPGAVIPREIDIADQYGVNRSTARRAVTLLRAEGLVAPVKRRGTVVRDRTPVRLSVTRYADVLGGRGDRGPWETACDQQGLPARTEIVAVERRTADAYLAEQLDLPEGAAVVRRLQHMYAGNQVAQVQETWLPLDVAEGTPLAGSGKVVGGIYRALTAAGQPPASADELVTSRMPTRVEADALSLDLGSPVLAVDRITRSREGRALSLTRAVIAGDRVSLRYGQTFFPGGGDDA